MLCDPDLIRQMKDEHAEIFHILDEVKRQQAHSNQSKQLLNKHRALIVRHIEHENAAVYPYVKHAAETDPVLERVLEVMNISTEQVLDAVVTFLDSLNSGNSPEDVDRDFDLICDMLKNRIVQEEVILFKIIPDTWS